MESSAFGHNPQLRASDADRDRAAAVINGAMAEGRLTVDEHAQRLDALYAAKTHADIVPLLHDLPGQALAASPRVAAPARGDDKPDNIVAVLSGATRKGTWHPAAKMNVVTVLGGVEMDLREAVLPGREMTITAVCVLGGMQITVPPEMRVVDSGVAILGGREVAGDTDESAGPDAPVLRINGTCVLGGVEVRRRPRSRKRRADGSRPGIEG